MTLRLFDTAARELRDLTPLEPGKVGIYLCGATVQSAPHVGHMRAAVAFDVLVRWLRRGGLDVTLVRNVTDIDDKILAKAEAAGRPWWAHAALFERAFTEAYDALGVDRPTYEPRATGHVTDMVDLMERLVERGHAYTTTPGNVFFDVGSYPEYGSLTRQRREDLQPAEETADAHGKRHPHDFALWKANRPGEPATASWPTPFGPGRPGWHLECSAMARRYLGDEFDIHGGGLDLRFPHHENEQAQSRAAGLGFAQHWMHSAWVTQGGTKMSKSLGNGLGVAELLEHARPAAVRWALATVHYRSMLEWTDETLVDAEATWARLEGFVERAAEHVSVTADDVAAAAVPQAFADAMDDDLNVSVALSVVHEALRAGNSALAARDDAALRAALLDVRVMLDVLGLDPASPAWAGAAGDDRAQRALDVLVEAELARRAQARADRDFATADAVRDRLAAAGVVVEDSPTGARWSLASDSPKDL